MKYYYKIFLVSILIIAGSDNYFAQNQTNNNFSFLLRGGYGIQYLGLGGNAEVRYNHYALYYSLGWMDKLPTEIEGFCVPATTNHAGGLRYYFYNDKDPENYKIRPAAGIHAGWVNKYWDSRIVGTDYPYNLYGIAFHGNVQFDFKYILLDVGLGIVPKTTIFARDKHPYISDLYWFPSVGIGFNFENIKRIKKENYNRKYEQNLTLNLVKKTKLKLKKNYKRGACGNTLLYQQIDSSRFLVVRINPEAAELSYNLRTVYIDTLKNHLEVYIIDKKISNDTLCCRFFNNPTQFENHIVAKAIKGNADIIINQKRLEVDNTEVYRISAELYDVEFRRIKGESLPPLFKYEEIILWDFTNSCFCTDKKE